MANLSETRRRFRRWLRRVHARALHPVSRGKIEAALDRVMPGRCRFVFMHSSLSNCGYIRGGPKTVLDAARARCDTLCLPTHSFKLCFPDEKTGRVPVFDWRETPSCVGAITEHFRRQPGVVRSINPTHSLAALGPDAEALCEGHGHCHTPCGAGTPYRKLVGRDASVLLFGAYRYTFFHTAEDAAGCSYMYYPEPVEYPIVDRDGKLRHVHIKRQNMTIKRRFRQVYPDLESEGLLHLTRLGRAHVGFIPSTREVHAFLLEQIQHNPFYLIRNGCIEKAKRAPAQVSSAVV